MSGASTVSFESISHFILLFLLLNSNMQMLVGFEKLVRNILCSGLRKFVGLHVFILIHHSNFHSKIVRLWKDNFSWQYFKRISQTLLQKFKIFHSKTFCRIEIVVWKIFLFIYWLTTQIKKTTSKILPNNVTAYSITNFNTTTLN